MIDIEKALVQALVYIGENHPLPPQTEEEHRAEILRLFPPHCPWGKPAAANTKWFYPDFKDFPEWAQDTFFGMRWTPCGDGYRTGVEFPRGSWRRHIEAVAAELTAAGFNITVCRDYLSADDIADRGRFCKTFLETVERLRKQYKIRYHRKKRHYICKKHTPGIQAPKNKTRMTTPRRYEHPWRDLSNHPS